MRQLQNYVKSMVIMTDEDGTVRSVPLALYKVKAVRMSAKRSLIDDLQNSFLLEGFPLQKQCAAMSSG